METATAHANARTHARTLMTAFVSSASQVPSAARHARLVALGLPLASVPRHRRAGVPDQLPSTGVAGMLK